MTPVSPDPGRSPPCHGTSNVTHSLGQDAQGSHPTKRRRITGPGAHLVRRKRAHAACQFCRSRKARCDNARPMCGFCRHHGAKCIFDDDDAPEDGLPQSVQISAAQQHEELLKRFDRIEELLQLPSRASFGFQAPLVLPALQSPAPYPLSPQTELGVASPPLPDRPSSRVRVFSPSTRCEAPLKWPIFKGVIAENDARIESFILEPVESVIGVSITDPMSASSTPSSSRGHPNNRKPNIERGIHEEALVPLCRKFLTQVHLRNPILEEDELMANAKSAAEHGLKWDASSCLVVSITMRMRLVS